jgi:hypothetical protein
MLRLCPWTRRRLTTTHLLLLAVSVGAYSRIAFLHVCFQQAVVILSEGVCRRFDAWEPCRRLPGRFCVYNGSEGVRLGLDERARMILSVVLPRSGCTRLHRLRLLSASLACTLSHCCFPPGYWVRREAMIRHGRYWHEVPQGPVGSQTRSTCAKRCCSGANLAALGPDCCRWRRRGRSRPGPQRVPIFA